MESEQDRPNILGYLMIHVSGYKQISSTKSYIFADGRAIPDRQVLLPDHEVNSMLWWEEGWAVGDNPRDRFCKWMGGSKIRRYTSFDEAQSTLRQLEKRRNKPHEGYTLVYGYTNPDGREKLWPVSTHSDIERIESQLAIEMVEAQKRLQAVKVATPAIDELRKHFKPSHAMRLSLVLKSINDNGRNSIPELMSKATFYRHIAELKKVGLVE